MSHGRSLGLPPRPGLATRTEKLSSTNSARSFENRTRNSPTRSSPPTCPVSSWIRRRRKRTSQPRRRRGSTKTRFSPEKTSTATWPGSASKTFAIRKKRPWCDASKITFALPFFGAPPHTACARRFLAAVSAQTTCSKGSSAIAVSVPLPSEHRHCAGIGRLCPS